MSDGCDGRRRRLSKAFESSAPRASLSPGLFEFPLSVLSLKDCLECTSCQARGE